MAVAIKVSINIYHGTALTAGNTAVPFRVVSTQRYPLRYFVAIGRAADSRNAKPAYVLRKWIVTDLEICLISFSLSTLHRQV